MTEFQFQVGIDRSTGIQTNESSSVTGPGRVFSGSGIWPKYGAGFEKRKIS